MLEPPKKIEINSDGNVLELKESRKDGTFIYEYTKSKTKKGETLILNAEIISKQEGNYWKPLYKESKSKQKTKK